MFRNHLKIAVRNLWKNKLVSSINLFGLTIGIGCSLLLLMYVAYENSYDSFMKDGDQIHLLISQEQELNGRKDALSNNREFDDLSENYALVQDALKMNYFATDVAVDGDDNKVSVDFIFATPNFFDFFEFPLASGSQETLLSDPSSIVITTETAMKLFGRTDVIGEAITIHAAIYEVFEKDLIVTGVVNTVDNSHIQFEAIVPWGLTSPNGNKVIDLYFGQGLNTYVKTVPGAEVKEIAREKNQRLSENEPDAGYEYYFLPMRELYLGSSDIQFSNYAKGNAQIVRSLFYIGLVILLVACINYVNLQTAKTSKRSLEVGMKKMLGAKRSQLVWQFMSEALLMTLAASCLAILLIDLTLPSFNNLTGKTFTIQSLIDQGLILFLLVVYLISAVLSGAYPALVLSSFRPARVLKNARAMTPGKRRVRSGLMLIQFSISICLMAVTYVIYEQSSFINKKEMGFNKEQVLSFDVATKNMQNRVEAFRKELELYPDIQSTTFTTDIIGSGKTNNPGPAFSRLNIEREVRTSVFSVDHSFIDTYEMELVTGRDFDLRSSADSSAIIVNQAFLEALSLDDPLESSVSLYRPEGRAYKIIGVLKDFHFQKLHEEIGPVVLRIARNNIFRLSVRLSPDNMPETLGFIEAKWNEFEPESAFTYQFVDQRFDRFYKDERRMLKTITFFSAVSIILTILGLFAMTVFSIEQRFKEISIRKVLGAKLPHMLALIHKDFLTILFFSIAIAAPIVYYLGGAWLDRFAYRIEMTVWPLALASLLTLVVIVAIVTSLAFRAVKANPVDALRNE